MGLLEKYITLTVVFTLSSAKSYYYDYPQPRRSFNINWTLRYPQPLISLDGVWPIAPPSPYPYATSNNNDYQYETPSYQQDILVQSLNKALTKLNMLLPPSNSKQETTPFPANTQPEVLAEALNKAIDRLGVILANQQMIQEIAEKEKEVSVTVQPDKMYESVNAAIEDLNNLFSTLPEELKPKPNQNNNNNVMKPIIMQPPLDPPFVSTIVSQTPAPANPLFTSDVLETKDDTTTPSVPTIVSNSGITESSDENLFTSFITDTPISSTVTNNVDNNKVSENPATEINMDTTTYVPLIDIRFKENETDTRTGKQDIIFPDDDDDDVDLASRFKENTTVTTQPVKPQTNPLNQVDLTTEKTTTTQNPQLILTYKPSRPPFHPEIFPPNPTVKPQTDSNLTPQQQNKPNVEIVDRFQQTTTTTQNPQLILTYKPSRPPFHPEIFPPNPTSKPDSNLQNQNIDLSDRLKPTTEKISTTVPYYPTPYYSTPISLEYKPSRPFYAPNPIVYPRPGQIPPGTPWPASSTERVN